MYNLQVILCNAIVVRLHLSKLLLMLFNQVVDVFIALFFCLIHLRLTTLLQCLLQSCQFRFIDRFQFSQLPLMILSLRDAHHVLMCVTLLANLTLMRL